MSLVPYVTGTLAPLYAMKHGLCNVLIFADSMWSRATVNQSAGHTIHRELVRLFKPDAWAGVVDNTLGEAALPAWVTGDTGTGTGVVGTTTRNPWDAAGASGQSQYSPKVTRETQFNSTTLTADILCMRRYLNAANGYPWTGGAWFANKTLTFRAIYYTHANGCNGLQLIAFSPTIGTVSGATTVNQRNAVAGVQFADATLNAGTLNATSLTGMDLKAPTGTTFALNSFFNGIGVRIFDPNATKGLQIDHAGFTGMFTQRLIDDVTTANIRAYNAATAFTASNAVNVWWIADGRNDAGQGETKASYKTKMQTFMAEAPAGTLFILQSSHSNPTDDAWLVQMADGMNEIAAARSDTCSIDMYRAFADATMDASVLNFPGYLDEVSPNGLHLNGIGVNAFAAMLVGFIEAGAATAAKSMGGTGGSRRFPQIPI
jgi:hypothetical protein